MDQARLNALIAAGLAQGAQRLGAPYSIFRATTAFDPLSITPVGTVMAVFDPSVSLNLTGVDDRTGSSGSLIGDFSALQPGDYLVGENTWFVSHIEPLRAAACVRCNHTVSVRRPLAAFTTGPASYGGRVPSTDTILASNWPASVLIKTHLDTANARLPGDVRTVFVEVLLPTIPGVTILHGQILTDESGQTYSIAATELSDNGWRIAAGLETT